MKESTIKKEKFDWDELNLDYSGENNYASFLPAKSNIHSYPAKAVPEMVSDLLKNVNEQYKIKSVLDPFVGSGTTALETKYLGLDFYGSDLNPLAILISRTKVLTLSNANYIIKTIKSFLDVLKERYNSTEEINIVTFSNIEYWFKETNIREFSYLKENIKCFLEGKNRINRESYALILCTAFSSTIRMCSLSRNSEFKLYRMSPSDINRFNVNAIDLFVDNVNNLFEMLKKTSDIYKDKVNIQIELDNAKKLEFLKEKKVDFILTSPPYGDSRSTVAYGQFSRLSLQWMSDLICKYLNIKVYTDNCDEYLLGGKKSEIEIQGDRMINSSKTLQNLINKMDRVIEEELVQLNEMRQKLIAFQKMIQDEKIINRQDIEDNLFDLIRERIRLNFYRKINKEASYTIKEVKLLSIESTEQFFNKLFLGNEQTRIEATEILEEIVAPVMETIKRKLVSVPRRKEEVLNFFKDLYQVVLRSDEVLNDDGIQAWIVGHRTVLGKLNINMKEVLNDWFNYIGYKKITDLTREYSFKRLPHHINSTVNRNDQIQTMMQEHILIVQKG
ncbi:DNA methyltransferase [Brevibacillus laterosporus]|uniref:DNA methyltransferase n=1 Tax=Brevibacillus laterosporus TaxID=1465 RepID=UPI003D1BB2F6